MFFQNTDDYEMFTRLAILSQDIRVQLVNGSGVNVDEFRPVAFPSGVTRFLLIARLLGDKGIREYVAAGRALKRDFEDIELHLVGGADPSPDGISQAEVAEWHDAGIVVWHGEVSDVREFLSNAHVYVLPSYREGTPRTVLEAMAMGRAIVTTDAPGCRETVLDGENGFIVPVQEVGPLIQAMRRLIEAPDLAKAMGAASRTMAVEKYDVHKVNQVMIDAMGL